MKTSEKLREVLSFLDSCESSLMYYQNEVETENKRLQDFIHYIELEDKASARSKKCTEFRKSRKWRRECKDKAGELEPIVNVLKSKEWKKIRNMFSQAMGEIRKHEQYEDNREYKPRVKDSNLDEMMRNAFRKDGK